MKGANDACWLCCGNSGDHGWAESCFECLSTPFSTLQIPLLGNKKAADLEGVVLGTAVFGLWTLPGVRTTVVLYPGCLLEVLGECFKIPVALVLMPIPETILSGPLWGSRQG